MGIIIAVVFAVAASLGAGAKEGFFKKGSDTTRRDTVAFEKNALEQHLVRVESKERKVVELKSGSTVMKLATLDTTEEKLKTKIAKLEKLEKEKGWNE